MSRTTRVLAIIGPGILVAATGVGGADLATGAIAGSMIGPAVLWAVIVGTAMKFLLTEGLARWQLATGDTLLEGCVAHFGRPVQLLFLAYLLIWSVFVGSALMSSCGITAHAIFPMVLQDPITLGGATAEPESQGTILLSGKILFGLLHSVVAVVMVIVGGYRLFEKVMGVCIALMFVTVMLTAVAVGPDWSAVAAGLVIPSMPRTTGEELQWTVALIGGVGGTLTVLCYGYWIREEGREGPEQLSVCRIDLATGYTMTALFGIGMVIIGSRIQVEGSGSLLIVQLADALETSLGSMGPVAKWAFLIGAWGAVFSSLLGVWQSVPYIFADFWNMVSSKRTGQTRIVVDPASAAYRGYLFALATIPAVGLWVSFVRVQKYYTIFGAAFIPLLALVLLVLNGKAKWIGREYRNSKATAILLVLTLVFFLTAGWLELRNTFGG